jgi:hypothetical protein
MGPVGHAGNRASPFSPLGVTTEHGDSPAGDGVRHIGATVLTPTFHRNEQVAGLHVPGVQLHLTDRNIPLAA